jgi:hypothetical protein
MSDHVQPEISKKIESDTPGHVAPRPTLSDPGHQEQGSPTHPDTRYVSLLERDNEFLREQVKKKDDQISDLSNRFSETQTLLGAMQRMFAPLLGQGDPFKNPPENREVRDTNVS